MSMTKQEELKGLLKEVMSPLMDEALEKAEAKREERIKAIEQMTGEMREKVQALANQPAQKRTLVDVTSGRSMEILHRGYRLDVQGMGALARMKQKAAYYGMEQGGPPLDIVDLRGTPILEIPQERRERYAKFVLDVIAAKRRNPDLGAMAVLADYSQKAALQEGTAAEGGYIVPEEFTAEILAFARLSSLALQYCRIWPMSSDTRRIPAEDGAVSVAWTAEETAATESEPTLTEVALSATKLDAFGIMSNELLQDSSVDVVSWLTELFGEAIGQELDNQVFNGTGSPCSGILTAACGYSVSFASTLVSWSSITADHLSQMIQKLPINRLPGSRFFLHRDLMHYVRTLKTTTDDYVFARPGAGVPGTIWEYPYSQSEKMPARSGAEAADVIAAFGNLRYFAMGRRLQNMTLDLDPYSKFKEYQTQFRIVNRWGMKIGLAGGFVRLLTAAS